MVASNQGIVKSDFKDFKIDFPIQESDFNYKKLSKRFSLQKQLLRAFSNILAAIIPSHFLLPVSSIKF